MLNPKLNSALDSIYRVSENRNSIFWEALIVLHSLKNHGFSGKKRKRTEVRFLFNCIWSSLQQFGTENAKEHKQMFRLAMFMQIEATKNKEGAALDKRMMATKEDCIVVMHFLPDSIISTMIILLLWYYTTIHNLALFACLLFN